MKDAFWGQIFCLLSAGGATIEMQILLERYAYSEISGTSILI